VTDIPQMPGIPVELYETRTTHDNGTEVTVRFDDQTELTIEFGPDSEEAAELLELLTRLVNDKLRVIASRGIEITGFAPPEEDDE
jgi:hypothetical protein